MQKEIGAIMQAFNKEIAPGENTIGILRVDRFECPIHGLYSAVVMGYRNPEGTEVITDNDNQCHYCVREREEKARQIEEYEKYRNSRIASLMEANGVTGIFEEVGYVSFLANQLREPEKKHVMGLVMAWVSRSFQNLILSGAPGTGKTLLGSIAVNELCYDMKQAVYITEQKLYRELRSVVQYPEREGQLIDKFGTFDYLVIDELGRSAGTEYEARLLAEIVDSRYKLSKSTMLCTNMSLDELTVYLGDNVIRRIAANGRRAKCDWPPFREAVR
jgi:DNA replication protein DnaC